MRIIRDAVELEGLEAKERYSLPADAREELEAKKADEEPPSEPESEAERRLMEFDCCASRFTAVACGLEEEKVPRLEENAEKAEEEAEPHNAEERLQGKRSSRWVLIGPWKASQR